MLVISRIAASAIDISFHDTRPVHANPAKMAASDRRSTSVSSRRPGWIARSKMRPIAGAKSNTMPQPVDADVAREEREEQDPLFRLVWNARQPAARDPRRVRVEWHLLEADTVIHGNVNREEQDRQRRSEKH